jgi:hypothetical protein
MKQERKRFGGAKPFLSSKSSFPLDQPSNKPNKPNHQQMANQSIFAKPNKDKENEVKNNISGGNNHAHFNSQPMHKNARKATGLNPEGNNWPAYTSTGELVSSNKNEE